MPRNNKKRNNNHQQRNRHNQLNGNNVGGGGGGVQKWSNHNNRNGGHQNNNRKIFFKPSLINALEEEDGYEMRNNNQQYENDSNRNNNNQNNNRKKKKRQNRGVIESLKNLGVVKEKLVIGEDEDSQVKKFIPTLPHCRVSSIPEDVFAMIVSYVQDYFTCYDSDRDRLLGAYNPKVLFSLSLNMGNSLAHVQYRFDENYYQKNRNLRRMVGNDSINKRHRVLTQGQIDTVACLCKLPSTEHEPRSFKLDSCFFMPNMISFVVTGVYKEGKANDKVRPLRSFSRSFVCIPDAASRMTIINEQFVLSHLTHDQYMLYYNDKPASAATSSQVTNENVPPALQTTQSTLATSSVSIPPELVGLNEQQIQLATRFSAESRLNLQWSRYILEHANWVWEEAGNSFIAYKDSIPKDAYLS